MRLLLLVLLAVGAFFAARWFASEDDWVLAENRVWIERMPRTPRDVTKKIVFIHDDGTRIGGFVRGSEFRMFIDTFFWFRRDDGRVRMTFPQDQTERMPAVRAWRCEAPEPFQLCLEMREGDRREQYFSREDWVVGSVNEALAWK